MSPILVIAWSNLHRFVRNRSFFVLAIIAPLGISAALSVTIGPALSGEYRPSLVIVDELGGRVSSELAGGLRDAGFEDLELTDDAEQAREKVTDGEADAAIVFPAALGPALADPTASSPPIVVVSDAQSGIGTSVAEAIATESGQELDTIRVLGLLGIAPGPEREPTLVVTEESAGSRVLTDGTYFAVGMTAYFAFFAASALIATIHRERRHATLARMLIAPIGRAAPLIGKALAAAAVALLSYLTMVLATSLVLGADWGPLWGAVLIGVALCFTAVGISLALTSVTHTEDGAGQLGAVLATAWAMFGGVFLPIPVTGPLSALTRLSPFRWVMDGIGLNAGVGSTIEVVGSAVGVAAFGAVGLGIAMARRHRLEAL